LTHVDGILESVFFRDSEVRGVLVRPLRMPTSVGWPDRGAGRHEPHRVGGVGISGERMLPRFSPIAARSTGAEGEEYPPLA